MKHISKILTVLLVSTFGVSVYAGKQDAQDSEIPGDDTVTHGAAGTTTTGPLSIKGFLSVGSQAAENPISAGSNGFTINNARLALSGDLKSDFKLMMQWDFVSSKPLLDALISVQIAEDLRLKAGKFKVPFSEEYLIPAANIDMPNRSQAVSYLAPGRRAGIELRRPAPASGYFAFAGFFDNSNETTNSNNDLLSAARFGYVSTFETSKVRAGISAAHGRDSNVELPFSNPAPTKLLFSGTRTLAGADIRWTHGSAFLSSEAVFAWMDSSAGPYYRVSGYQVTGGYNFNSKHTGLIRFDSFDSEVIAGLSQMVVIAFSATVPNTQLVTWQVGYQYSIQKRETSQLLGTLNAVF